MRRINECFQLGFDDLAAGCAFTSTQMSRDRHPAKCKLSKVTQNTTISAERNGLGIAFVNRLGGTPMLRKLSLLLLGILLFTGAASLNAQVKTDYDHTANFATYKTYSWLKVQVGDSLWDDRMKQDVDAQLAAKGWTKVDSNGDAAVSAFRSTQNQQTLNTFYDGFGGGWRWRGFGGRRYGHHYN
jgi:hypothetical protein